VGKSQHLGKWDKGGWGLRDSTLKTPFYLVPIEFPPSKCYTIIAHPVSIFTNTIIFEEAFSGSKSSLASNG
jgi:hypothetical protein